MLSRRVYHLFKTNVKFRKSVSAASVSGSNGQQNYSTEVNVVKSPFPDVQVPNISLDEFLWRNLERYSDKTGVVCGVTNKSITYHELYKKSRALGRALRWKLKLQPGDTVAIVLPNVPEYYIILLGAIHAGVTVTTVNPIYTVDEISKQLIDSNSKFIFTLNSLHSVVESAAQKVPNKTIRVIVTKSHEQEDLSKNSIKLEELIDNDLPPIDTFPQQDGTALLPYSSGTTGLPKGVVLTYKNILSNLMQMQTPEVKLNENTTDSFQDSVPNILPLFHIYGIIITGLNMVSEGVRLITLPKFRPQPFLNLLSTYRPTLLHCAPPIVLFLLNYPEAKVAHIESLRYLMTGAAPLGATDIERFNEKTKGQTLVIQGYGLTETSPLTHVQSPKVKPTSGSIGPNLPNTDCKIVSIDDESRVGLGPNQTGELLIRGPQVMKGYLNNKEATDNAIVDGGWFRTGDIGHYDENGFFFITDRMKELIKVKGFQVAPAELEALLRHHPDITDAAVVGTPHPQFGEVPKAFIVLKKDSKISLDDVHNYVNASVAEYKRLKGGIALIDTIPKSLSGKILRRELKNM